MGFLFGKKGKENPQKVSVKVIIDTKADDRRLEEIIANKKQWDKEKRTYSLA